MYYLDSVQFDSNKYKKILESCALNADIENWPNGDETKINEIYSNLSSCQKTRICLARTLYQKAGIYLLDDPFFEVDSLTKKFLFQYAIGPKSMSVGSTRIVVSNCSTFLPQADLIVFLKGFI